MALQTVATIATIVAGVIALSGVVVALVRYACSARGVVGKREVRFEPSNEFAIYGTVNGLAAATA